MYVFYRPRFFSFTETRDGYTIIVEEDLCKGAYMYYVNKKCKCKRNTNKKRGFACIGYMFDVKSLKYGLFFKKVLLQMHAENLKDCCARV